MSKLVFCLMGPTASGKTALACELVTSFPMEVISVDSAMIYRGMTIGTAKPSIEELTRAPHHLIDIKNPTESYSAAEFCADALSLCASITAKGKIPLLVGGTMMYFNALQKGLAVLPEADESIRKTLEQEATQHGWPHLHQKLTTLDPLSGARIHPHDAQRIARALEVYYLTGNPLSSLRGQNQPCLDYSFINIALFPNQRSWLHDRIALRFDEMLALGFIDEVRQLTIDWDLSYTMPSMRCVGYRQIFEYLAGHCEDSVLRDKGIAATRQLAKRQLTWLRHWDSALFYDPQQKRMNQEITLMMKQRLDEL